MVRLTLFLTLLGISIVLYANSVLAASSANIITQPDAKKPEQLQIGEIWSRIQFDGRLTSTEALNKVIMATARVDLKDQRGTAFYLGQYNGAHLMLTNYHVLTETSSCKNTTVYFRYLNKRYRCQKVIHSFPNIEATFFTVSIPNGDAGLFIGKELRFDFTNEYKPGHKIVTAGYGIHINPKDNLTYESSQTCVVASSTFTPQLLSIKQKGSKKVFTAYSFAHACEISNGDSGAALVSEITNKVVGLNWATSTAKPLELLQSNVVFDWIEKNDPRIWGSLSYGVPAGFIAAAIHESKSDLLKKFVAANVADNLQ